MRNRVQKNGLTLNVVAGTYVVTLGWDILDASLKNGLLGFAIQRVDRTENETYWMRGMKTFPSSPPLALGGTASTHEQPLQTFQWADYAAKPGHEYTYTLVAMYGRPGGLKDGPTVSIDVKTESEWDGTHSIFFNRGAVASQEYARRFQNQAPNVVGQAAYDWLSRGLLESIIAFVEKATGAGFGLRVAIYEFQWSPILQALGAAAKRGVDVKVLYDGIDNAKEDPVHKNEEAIEAAGIGAFCQGLTQGKIMHNKFIVLLRNGAPTEVLTGSTNYTENGLFGHLNCSHIVNDAGVAGKFLEYWTELEKDQPIAGLKPWDDANSAKPPNPPNPGTGEVFSPQTGKSTLTRYVGVAGSAKRALFMTFAFGMTAFVPVYQQVDDVLHFALMDKEGTGKAAAAEKQAVDAIRELRNAVIAVGQNITMNEFDRWLKELSGIPAADFVRWVHTKFMLVDPLSDDPIVITGSANFSGASIDTNHENMLVIRGDRRVADIYLGEFMRQFTSYAFRDAAKASSQSGAPVTFRPQDLIPDGSWIQRYEGPGTSGEMRRLYFSGQ